MRTIRVAAIVMLAAVSTVAAPKLFSVWKAPDVSGMTFANKKVAALVITDDQSLQMAGEEALTRELTSRGASGVASYRIVPREEIKSADRARSWFERTGVEGVVVIRPMGRRTERTDSPVVWSSGYYPSLWGYYDYGWNNVYIPLSQSETTIVVVETLIYDVAQNKLVWAAMSETKNPKELQNFVKDLVNATAREMKKMKLIA